MDDGLVGDSLKGDCRFYEQWNKTTRNYNIYIHLMQLNSADLFDVAVIGAGPAGLAIISELLHQRPKLRIAWIDPEFECGRLSNYANVPSNTKVGLFLKYCRFVERALLSVDASSDVKERELFKGFQEDDHCPLSLVAEMVSQLVHKMQQIVSCVRASVKTAIVEGSFLIETDAGQHFRATSVILATGCHPKVLNDKPYNVIPLEVALDPCKLQVYLSANPTTNQPIYVFGASHSGILALRNITLLGVQAVCVYKHPPKYAIYQENNPQIIYDNTGLKGIAAQWARHHWDSLDKVQFTNDHLNIDYKSHQVVQAIGFERNESLSLIIAPGVQTIKLSDLHRIDGGRLCIAGGNVIARLYGVGIAFPGLDVYEYQGKVIQEESVGLFKFCRHSIKDVSVILAELDQHHTNLQ